MAKVMDGRMWKEYKNTGMKESDYRRGEPGRSGELVVGTGGGSADATTATTTSSGWRSVPDGTSVKHE